MKKILVFVCLFSVLFVAGVIFASKSSASDKVTICHATGSETNPFVEITVSLNALKGHEQHGDVIPAPDAGCDGISPDPLPE
jgi:ABC-type sugar transport system substrate-binding protein